MKNCAIITSQKYLDSTNNLKMFMNLMKDQLPHFHSIVAIFQCRIWSMVIADYSYTHTPSLVGVCVHIHAMFYPVMFQ